MVNKRKQKTIYIEPELNDFVLKYISKNKTEDGENYSYSEIVNIALRQLFKIESTKDSLQLTTQIIESAVEKNVKKYFDRLVALQSKNTKTSYASSYLLSNLLAVLYQTDDEREFIKEKMKEADELRL